MGDSTPSVVARRNNRWAVAIGALAGRAVNLRVDGANVIVFSADVHSHANAIEHRRGLLRRAAAHSDEDWAGATGTAGGWALARPGLELPEVKEAV
jgi:hypothetical protein